MVFVNRGSDNTKTADHMQILTGFSKLGRMGKTDILKSQIPLDGEDIALLSFFHEKISDLDRPVRNLSENYISNFVLPFSVAPNFVVNGKAYFLPMVTEESSVVAAASYAAKFWAGNGGFHTTVTGTVKQGQIWFTWGGDISLIMNDLGLLKEKLIASVKPLLEKMQKRGGGIRDIKVSDETVIVKGCKTVDIGFETVDSMGANFINSCLEIMAEELTAFLQNRFPGIKPGPEIIMAILSNYTPRCLAECAVECEISCLAPVSGSITPEQFAVKFEKAVRIAQNDLSRAVTHNKGIFNGIDAVLIATGNDFRAVEAGGHAFAAREGIYKSLSDIEINQNKFTFRLRLPLALGTVGGATSVHPMAGIALRILHRPTATELMQIVAAAGLACNFAAITSLITGGIQKGHMKLHINNILSYFNATENERAMVAQFFRNRQISFSAVSAYLDRIRE
jgi:hydroxymethylglutaryl-CoA reductase